MHDCRVRSKIVFSLTALMICYSVNTQAAIIDLNARTSLTSPVVLTLAAGTYNVVPVGTPAGAFTAGNLWGGGSSCGDPNGCVRTDPTTATGWLHFYTVSSPNLTSVKVDGMSLSPVLTPPTSPNLDTFFEVSLSNTQYRAGDGFVYQDASSAFNNAVSSMFTLSAPGDVEFWFWDRGAGFLSDNVGGVSLNVSTVPIPSSLFLFATGLVSVVVWRLKNKRSA